MAEIVRDQDPVLTELSRNLNAANLPKAEELDFLNELLQSKELNALVHIHNKILNNAVDDRRKYFPIPVLSDSMQVLADVLELLLFHLQERRGADAGELFQLLQKHHLQGLLCAHDAVAQKDYYPHLPDLPPSTEDDPDGFEEDGQEQTIKIVQLVKSNEPLGATIKMDDATGKIVIARVMHGGAADRSGLIHVGDEVVEVNSVNVEGKSPNDVLAILQSSEGTITFKLIPAESKTGIRESKVRVRAHFDYDSSLDQHIPCKEAGLDFQRGDVLHIVSQDDQYWWQARREGDKNARAGLIPSRSLQEKRILIERGHTDVEEEEEDNGVCPVSELDGCAPKNKTKKIVYDAMENDDFDREFVATYEEVAKLYPRPGIFRPLVLIGAPGVGRNELKRRLIDTDPQKYRTPIPYTSRPKKPGEIDGKEYCFTSRVEMEAARDRGEFIEFGEYKGNLYGTRADSVRTLVSAGHVCVLTPHYQALKMLRTPNLRPYVIYIEPPTLRVLKDTRTAYHARSTFDANNSRGFTDDEFEDMVRHARRIEFHYGHLFDAWIVNDDLGTAFAKLLDSVRQVEMEPMWVPTSWVQ